MAKAELQGSPDWNGDCVALCWTHDAWHQFQCTRKASRMVGRMPLCGQHANIVEKRGMTTFSVAKEMLADDVVTNS